MLVYVHFCPWPFSEQSIICCSLIVLFREMFATK
uniref:Uncharacterized protein n=1 Tax=Rhizophora mucronata TaxID=61149 RepID=A0A2P2NG76_RHIMU